MRRAYILFSPELLFNALKLPTGTSVYGAEWEFDKNALRLYVESPDLVNIPDGAQIPQVSYSAELISVYLND